MTSSRGFGSWDGERIPSFGRCVWGLGGRVCSGHLCRVREIYCAVLVLKGVQGHHGLWCLEEDLEVESVANGNARFT